MQSSILALMFCLKTSCFLSKLKSLLNMIKSSISLSVKMYFQRHQVCHFLKRFECLCFITRSWFAISASLESKVLVAPQRKTLCTGIQDAVPKSMQLQLAKYEHASLHFILLTFVWGSGEAALPLSAKWESLSLLTLQHHRCRPSLCGTLLGQIGSSFLSPICVLHCHQLSIFMSLSLQMS